MDYEEIARVGGIPKPVKHKKEKKRLLQKTSLRAHYEPMPKNIRQEIFEIKGNKCLMGLCEHCGGMAEATDLHHFPHRSQNGKDVLENLWPINRICHIHYHDHPKEEREIFKVIEAAGWKVVWKAETKGVLNNG